MTDENPSFLRRFGVKIGRKFAARVASMALVGLFALGGTAWASRMAVVIGNGDYVGVTPLKNPVNDANLLGDKLESLDFEVLELTDLSKESLWTELDSFISQAEEAEIILFYFSGHAFQLENVNYLVPVDARLNSVDAIATQTWALNDILQRFEALKTNTVVMLDACRNNPLPASMQAMTGGTGLARIESGADTKVVFATQPQAVAYEGTGDVSYFTQAVLDHIETENQSLDDLIRNVRNQVRTETSRRQVPWSGGNLSNAFYFKRAAEKRDTLNAADIENLLLNFPAEQRPLILAKLAQTVDLDLDAVETRIASIAPTTTLSVLIEGDTVDQVEERPNNPAPGDPSRSAAVAVMSGRQTALTESPVPARRPSVGLAQIAGGDTTVTLLEGGETPNTSAMDRPPIVLARVETRERGRAVPAIKVTRANIPMNILPTTRVPVPVRGSEYWLDDEDSRDALVRQQPALVETVVAVELGGKPLARATQSELDRLGCYRDRVDGAWGRNSRFALTSYYLAKGILFDDLEPSNGLLRQLELEPNVICTGVEARAPKVLSRADVIAKPAPKAKVAPRGTISNTVREEIKTGGTFVGIRVR